MYPCSAKSACRELKLLLSLMAIDLVSSSDHACHAPPNARFRSSMQFPAKLEQHIIRERKEVFPPILSIASCRPKI